MLIIDYLGYAKIFLIFSNVCLMLFSVYLYKRKLLNETSLQLLQQQQTKQTTSDLQQQEQEQQEQEQQQQDDNNAQQRQTPNSSSDGSDSQLQSNEERKKRVLLVIAHPDDESMFFAPTLSTLQEASDQFSIHILCLSSGNAEHKGALRVKELQRACQLLGIVSMHETCLVLASVRTVAQKLQEMNGIPHRIFVVDDETVFRDGMNTAWDERHVAHVVQLFVRHLSIDLVLTFDDRGVSCHPNHMATFRGVNLMLSTHYPQGSCVGYALETTSTWKKYIGWLALIIGQEPNPAELAFVTPQLFQAFKAMQAHHSQFVWFRKLYILWSRYAYLNTWKRIE